MKRDIVRTSISMDAKIMEDLKIEAIKKRVTVSKLLETILIERKPNKFKDLYGGQQNEF
jgi:hypothetical protein